MAFLQVLITVVASDANNCSVSSVVVVTEPPILLLNVVSAQMTCAPNSGFIGLSASGGLGWYTYSIPPGNPSNLQLPGTTLGYVGFSAGVYIATVTDANGCSDTAIETLIPPPALSWVSTGISNANPCDPDTVLVLAGGGTSPITYTLNPGNVTNATGLFASQTPGTYTISAVDVNNCSVTTNVTITGATPNVVSSSVVQPLCGQANGSISEQVSWGSTTFNYVLNPGNITNTTGVFNSLTAGTYTVSIQNTSCPLGVVLDTFVLSSKLNPYPISNTSNSFTATVPTNGMAPYAYSINGQSIALPQSGLRCTGVDTFRITDAGGCVFDSVFNFTSGNSFLGISLNKNVTDASCALTNDGQIIYAPSATLIYEWLSKANVLGSMSNNISNLIPDVYVVKLHNANGDCIQDTSTVGTIGTACGNISGIAFYDTLVNCSYDTVEIPLANVTVTLMPGNIQRITNAQGEYEFLGLSYGNYNVEVDTNAALIQYPSCNLIQYDTLTASANSIVNNFPYDSVTQTDIYTYTPFMVKVPAAAKGSFARRQPVYYGHSNFLNTVNVNLYAVMDSIHHFDFSSVTPTSINGDTLMWQINSVTSGNHFLSIYYDSIQSLPINHLMPFKVWIEPNQSIVGNPTANDTSCVNLRIATSYDPNDKQVNPQGVGTPGYIEKTDSTLSYLVRFQNTGNAMAFNIHIDDTLSNRLDINSLKVLGASHPYMIEKDNNVIRFRFDNVMLPDSNADEPNSHGYILYEIKQDAGNIKGDVINNTAHIYFDYNPAVVTNTTINTIGLPTVVENVTRTKSFNVYPNPTNGQVFIQELENRKINSITLYDILGREINLKPVRKSKHLIKFSIQELPMGVYLLNLDGESVKIIKE